MRMLATYRNIFSLLQHSCAQHPAPLLHPIRLETSVTPLENSPTLNYCRTPMRESCPAPARCVHTRVPSHPPPRRGARARGSALLPIPSTCCQGHSFKQYVKSSVAATLNINLQGRGLPFMPFHVLSF